jgi:hypothetical protein
MAKDTDSDGVPDSQDQWPNDPSLPAKSDVAGILGVIGSIGLDLGSLGVSSAVSTTDKKAIDLKRVMRTSGMAMGMAPSDYSLDKAPASALTPALPTGATGTTGTASSSRQVSKNVKQFSTQQVLGIAESAFKAAIGRTATTEELAALRGHINAQEKKNPTISKSSSYSSGTGSSSSSTTTSGGIDEAQMAKTFAESNPEYAGYQKATTYFDSMMSALRGTVGGGI